MIPLTAHPSVVEKYSKYFSEHFNKAALEHFKTYLTGLITGEDTTVSAISRRVVSGKDQSSLNRFLTQSPWDRKEVNRERIKLIRNDPRLRPNHKGYGVLDDTLTHKTGKHIEAVSNYKDHVNGGYTLGHILVNSLYADQRKRYPINHRLYLKHDYCQKHNLRFKTKNEFAAELIDDAYEQELNIKTWLFDSAYMNKIVISKVESYGADWVSEMPQNRILLRPEGEVPVIKYLREDVPFKAYKKVKLGGKVRYYFTKTVVPKSLGGRRVRICALFDKKDLSDDPKILATNKLNWTSPKKVYEAYSHRWSLETFYRDSKQNLGLESYQLRSIESIQKHWCLVELAYTLLTVSRLNCSILEKVSNQMTTLGQAAEKAGREVLESFVYWIHKQLAESQGDPAYVCDILFSALAPKPKVGKGCFVKF